MLIMFLLRVVGNTKQNIPRTLLPSFPDVTSVKGAGTRGYIAEVGAVRGRTTVTCKAAAFSVSATQP
jgi:hypothetical protein